MRSHAGLGDLTDLVLPRLCPCGRPGPVCADCRRPLDGRGPALLVRPYPTPPGMPDCAAAAPYTGAVRRLLITYKERGRRDLARMLGLALWHSLGALPGVVAALESRRGHVLLVPVPASRAAFRARGVDHVSALIKALLAQLRPDLRRRVRGVALLEPTRRVADQAGLDAAGRKLNVARSLCIRPGGGRYAMRGSPTVVVIDDILTSGATIAEAARALRAGGVHPGAAAVVAAVMPRRSLPDLPLSTRGDTV